MTNHQSVNATVA